MKKQLPNILSLLNASCGMFALLVTLLFNSNKSVLISCVLILCGVVFDFFDGKLARKLNVTSQMGKELDSFADLITFGIAPSCVLIGLILSNVEKLYLFEVFFVVFYIICTIYRLARYNSTVDEGFFVGLPSTFSGLILSFYIFISVGFFVEYIDSLAYIIISMSLLALLGIFMVSKLKVKRI